MNRVNLSSNPSQRTPCILILDHSGSMNTVGEGGHTRIALLNDGIKAFSESLRKDPVALARVQIAAVSCGGDRAEPLLDWTDATEFEPFSLRADGLTPMAGSLRLALEMVDAQKKALREYGIPYTRPWVFIMTDGEPSDTAEEWAAACAEAMQAEQNGQVEIFTVAIGDADMSLFKNVSRRPPLKLKGLHFQELFVWLSASLGQMTRSTPGANVELPATDSWASVKL